MTFEKKTLFTRKLNFCTRRAKIVGTLGPSSSNVEEISNLILAGLDVARINFSHGTHEGHRKVILAVREASKRVGKEVAILGDFQGPKIRVDKVPEPLVLKDNEEWLIGENDRLEELKKDHPQFIKHFIPTVYKDLVKDASVPGTVLFDDGLIEAKSIEKLGPYLKIRVLVGGLLKSNKGINLPDSEVSAPSFTDKDREDLLFGLQNGIDYCALSFVRKKEDILEVKKLLHQLKVEVPIISKIERPEAITNIKDIIRVSDVIMIARGDMGVELGNHLVPAVQKDIIYFCNQVGKPVITATQMLESMIDNSRPTRAEASDVANAIWDGSDAVMLSGETASGKYPEKAVLMMSKIIEEAEKRPKERPLLRNIDLSSITSSVQAAASLVAEKNQAKLILAITESGNSTLKTTQFRPKVPILGVTKLLSSVRRMGLYWGVTPYLLIESQDFLGASALENQMMDELKKEGHVYNGDKIVVTRGEGRGFIPGSTNSLTVHLVKDAFINGEKHSGEQVQAAEWEKGKILLDSQICGNCQICIQLCPFEIFTLGPDGSGRPHINKSSAANCTLDEQCVQKCPTGAIEILFKS